MSTSPFLERNVEFLIECMDDLSMEQQKVSICILDADDCILDADDIVCLADDNMLTPFLSSSNSTTEIFLVNKLSSRLGFRKDGMILPNLNFIRVIYISFKL